ncbi:MAG: hypothetical protein IKK84_00025 [Clostridia bacterium]|nr:hypothetical protein [Clostridia bacterium]
MIKGYKWSLGTLISSWLELLGTLLIMLSVASYIEVIATHTLSWWNVFNFFLIGR